MGKVGKEISSKKLSKKQVVNSIKKHASVLRGFIEIADRIDDMDRFERAYHEAKASEAKAVSELTDIEAAVSDAKKDLAEIKAAAKELKSEAALLKDDNKSARNALKAEAEEAGKAIIAKAQAKADELKLASEADFKEVSEKILQLRGKMSDLDALLEEKQTNLANVEETIAAHKQTVLDDIEKLS